MAEYGFSFAPMTGTNGSGMAGRGQTGPATAPQRPVAVRNYQLPTQTVGARTLAPGALLTAPGGAGIPQTQLLQLLMAALAPRGQQGALSLGGQSVPMMRAADFTPSVSFTSQKTMRPTPINMQFPPSMEPTPAAPSLAPAAPVSSGNDDRSMDLDLFSAPPSAPTNPNMAGFDFSSLMRGIPGFGG